MLKKLICSILIVLFSFILCKKTGANPFGPLPPFEMGGSVGNTTYKGPIKKGQIFSFDVEVTSWDEPLTDVSIKISLPPEVEKWRGNLSWEGGLNPKSKKNISVGLTSIKDWKYWSVPIKAHVELSYKGKKYIREIEWSSKGFEDTCWLGGENAQFANRWCTTRTMYQ